nr:pentatricopeptide repeat-containing protein At3g48250, chloroplastic [Ipomoea batatas]
MGTDLNTESAIKALQKSVKALELQFDKIETLSTTVSSLSITSHNHAIALANLEKLVKQLLTQAGANTNISPDVASLLKAAQSMNVVLIPPGGGDPVDKPPAVGANTLPRHNCRHLFMLWTLEDVIELVLSNDWSAKFEKTLSERSLSIILSHEAAIFRKLKMAWQLTGIGGYELAVGSPGPPELWSVDCGGRSRRRQKWEVEENKHNGKVANVLNSEVN